MNNKLKRSMKRLTEMDAYMDDNIRNVYIDNIVSNLKRGIYPKGSLERIQKLIERHQIILKAKEKLVRG
ncbi:hypothetical protein HOE22_10920 [Candidatus Woesearchaeota archaeon]|jgi:hypothetical protein|nr:hypothetical protein [Candidatus Woesearchaeota archaeon]MBT4733054.1 hypothetical protein [Candidatus Woesearchaeota archaeon]MBT7558775.1 hypothetical protein [Candidatus Woesearchaeota archaeon]